MKHRILGAAVALVATLAWVTGPTGPALATPEQQPGAAALAPPDIDVAAVQSHLNQFNSIATSNGGNRRAGSGGYTQSLAYVKGKLQAAGFTVVEQRCSSCTYVSNNLIADWPGGDVNQTIMFGAHLDGVSAGPGINDNGSGSAVLLENALQLAARKPTLTKHVRFAWWTDEEQGLNGSKYYVSQLGSARSQIKAYYNFDMVASKNGGYFINNINTTAAAPLREYWTSLNLQPEENVEGAGRSDDYSFQQAGIPSSGYATGASARKTSSQASKWGGTANSAYDSCYHSRCDSTSNINPTALDRSADGIAYTIWKLAVNDNPTNEFSLSLNPSSGSIGVGSSGTFTVNTTTTSGSPQNVSLSASGAPNGVTVSFSPSSVQSGGSSTATVSVGSSVARGNYQITVTGTGTGTGAVTRTATYSLTVPSDNPGNEFSLSLTPSSASVAVGQSGSFTVNTATTSGSAQTVALSATGTPNGVTVSFSPSSVQSGSSSTATVAVASTTTAGTYQITVSGAGSVTRTATFTLTVTGGDTGGCGGLQAWSASASYVPDDLVSHNGRKYKSTWYSAGAEPGAPGSWAVWQDQGAC
ncbi:hypothetical protein GCM10022243_02500 [Saccharothrix violaceirubra]|uniref:Aminopeptidase S n=1 Tax=Saccharothrix violaceirubra TaxID=413306 RepID=A0A7W7T3S1_9PSEU|nr:M28 family peptidase [Saccharothrix violaceirubra]MBB4966008.1 aminopeptidase S [Saccharothrix violaceirubra]